jgi:hypothetical protein
MNRIMKTTLIAMLAVGLVGCGQKVEVPAAHIGKVMTKNGYKEGTISTSKFRLDPCFAYCDKLVVLNVADQAVTERMELFMPRDRLNMAFDVRLTIAVNPNAIPELFERIPPQVTERGDTISIEQAYNVYAAQIIRSEVREYLSTFSIAEIASSREAINTELSARLSKSIQERTPFIVRYVGLADVKFPEVIVRAQENAAERREAIQQEEAQLEIRRVQLERELEEQRMKRAIEVERSLAQAEVARIQGESMTPEYQMYRALDILEQLAQSDNKVFIPVEMLNSIASQVMIGNSERR